MFFTTKYVRYETMPVRLDSLRQDVLPSLCRQKMIVFAEFVLTDEEVYPRRSVPPKQCFSRGIELCFWKLFYGRIELCSCEVILWFVDRSSVLPFKDVVNSCSSTDAVWFASSPSPSARLQMLISSPADLLRQLRQQ